MNQFPQVPIDDSVLAAAVAGDQAAFEAVYRDVQPRLRRYAWSLVGQDADDVTGEAWLQIGRDIRTFSGGIEQFRAWTARIVRNRALDQVRAAARRPAVITGATTLLDTASEDGETVALESLSTEVALRLIAGLPPDQAEAVLLRAVVGLDAARCGEVLGKSAAAVRVAAHRGLRTLARRLEADAARHDGPRTPPTCPGHEE